MTHAVRIVPATAEHAGGWAEVIAAATPHLVVTAASAQLDLAPAPATRLAVVALDDPVRGPTGARVVGVCRLREWGGRLRVMVQVAPERRGEGIGRALLDEARMTAGDAPLAGIVNGDVDSLASARAWGVVLEREHRISAVDPRTVSATHADTADTAGTVALEDADPHAVWACIRDTSGDDPSGLSHTAPFEQWAQDWWAGPLHRADLGRAVVDDGRVLAVASVSAAGDRAWNAFTGTRPEARGRGLARRVKAGSLVAMAAAGITSCATGNDAANAAMLAVNDSLGYRQVGSTYDGVLGEPRPGPGHGCRLA